MAKDGDFAEKLGIALLRQPGLQRRCPLSEGGKLLLLQEEGAPDKNYYINEFGRMQVNAPWYGPEYHRLCTEIDWNDLEIS